MQKAEVQASLHIITASQEPLLFAHSLYKPTSILKWPHLWLSLVFTHAYSNAYLLKLQAGRFSGLYDYLVLLLLLFVWV